MNTYKKIFIFIFLLPLQPFLHASDNQSSRQVVLGGVFPANFFAFYGYVLRKNTSQTEINMLEWPIILEWLAIKQEKEAIAQEKASIRIKRESIKQQMKKIKKEEAALKRDIIIFLLKNKISSHQWPTQSALPHFAFGAHE